MSETTAELIGEPRTPVDQNDEPPLTTDAHLPINRPRRPRAAPPEPSAGITVQGVLSMHQRPGENGLTTLLRLLRERDDLAMRLAQGGPVAVIAAPPIEANEQAFARARVSDLQFCHRHGRGYRGGCPDCSAEREATNGGAHGA